MTKDEEIKSLTKRLRQMEKDHAKDPAKARRWLIRIGLLEKSGKRLARRYRS